MGHQEDTKAEMRLAFVVMYDARQKLIDESRCLRLALLALMVHT